MNSKRFSQELRDGKLLIGTLIASPSPMWPAAVDGIGLNYVFIDTEHIALDRSQVSWMCQVYSRMGCCLMTIKRAEKRGELHPIRINSHFLRYRESEIARWIADASSDGWGKC